MREVKGHCARFGNELSYAAGFDHELTAAS